MPSDPREGIFKRGLVVDLPGGEAERLARELAALGFLTIEERRYVRCVSPLDHDRRFARDLGCTGRIYLSDRDEDDHQYRCPSCDRTVFPSRKRHAATIRLTPKIEAISAFVREEIARAGVEVEEKPRGLYRVPTATGEVQVCLVDLCTDQAVFHDQYPYRGTVIFVVGNERDHARGVPAGARRFRLVDLALGETAASFRREIRRLAGLDDAAQVPTGPAILRLGVRRPAAIPPALHDPYPGVTRIPVPAGTPWSKVEIFKIDGDTVAVRVPGRRLKEYTYIELGMVDGRNKRRNKAWQIILAICEGQGRCHWTSMKPTFKNFHAFKQQVSDLRPRLQYIFDVGSDPFVGCSPTEGLCSLFRAEPDRPDDPYVGEKEWSKEGTGQI